MNHFELYLAFSFLLLSLSVNGKAVTIYDKLITETAKNDNKFSSTEVSVTESVESINGVKQIEDVHLNNLDCETQEFSKGEYHLLDSGVVYIAAQNKTLSLTKFKIIEEKLIMCRFNNVSVNESDKTPTNSSLDCRKWYYNENEFKVLSNGSVLLYGAILDFGSYEFEGSELITCADEYDLDNLPDVLPEIHSNPKIVVLIYIGQAGAAISIIALTLHLLVFACVPKQRNLPGYNLTSLSVALFMAYLFLLIGQIREVLGTPCVVSGSLQHYFFLVAFFWMNVISFDVWKALRLATKKLIVSDNKVMSKKFLFYAMYAWGLPLLVSISAAIVDMSSSISEAYKPLFGHNEICFFNNDNAKSIFFAIPAMILFTINGLLFAHSTYMILNNTMKNVNDQHKAAKRNFMLYARLGIIMGATWLFGIIAASFGITELWFVFDILNSLQGLFVFLLFTCTRKVCKSINQMSITQSSMSSFKRSFNTTKSQSSTTK